MSGISLTASMRSNLLSLQNIASQQDIVQNRLATGLKVSSAIDNPSSYYTASSLNNRAADLTALLDAMSQGIQTIKAASEAIASGTKFLEQAKAVANQALETTRPILATVRTEAELLAAVESGQRGFIIVDGTINMSANNSLNLRNGQALVGAKYFGLSDSYSSINFEMSGTTAAGIYVGHDSIVSDLNINYKTDCRGPKWGSSAIRTVNGGRSVLQNLNISMEAAESTNSSDAAPAMHIDGETSVDLRGTINIHAAQQGAAGRRIYGIAGNGTVNVSDNAQLNISTKGTLGFAINAVQLNIMNNAEVNLDSLAYPVLMQSATGTSINLQSSTSRLNLRSSTANAFYGSNGKDGDFIISAVKGATVTAANRQFTALTDVHKAMIQKGNTLNNTLNGQDNKFDDKEAPLSVSEVFKNIFDDFKTFMKEAEKNPTQIEKITTEYPQILAQYDALVSDASYKGINLLTGQKLKINFNEDRSSKIDVTGVKADSDSLGLKTKEWKTAEDIEKSVSELEEAINSLRSFASAFGNYYSIVTARQDFTENLINILEEGADKLTLADMNQESANMLALQTSQQLAVNSLSLASQAAQSILRLF